MKKAINYKKIEGILHSYCTIKCEITNFKIDIEELKDDISLGSVSDNPQSGRSTVRNTVSKVENEVFRREKRIAEIEREIRSRERSIKKVDNALEILNPEDKVFVELRYFNKIPMNNLAERYGVEPITMYKRKDSIVKQLITLL